MENETLFTEEAEPPGSSTGLVGIENYADDILTAYNTLLTPSAIKAKGVQYVFRFKESPRTRAFRKRFYPEVTSLEWSNWHWQYGNRIKDVEALSFGGLEARSGGGGRRFLCPSAERQREQCERTEHRRKISRR